MKELAKISQQDIEPGFVMPDSIEWYDRHAARAVLTDITGRVALLHSSKWNYYKLPGGGVEQGEDVATALAREILEEVGAHVEVIVEIGRIEEWRVLSKLNLHQISDAFLAKVVGDIGEPDFTEEELAEGFSVVWADDLSDAIEKVKIALSRENPEARFMSLRDVTFLESVTENRGFVDDV